MEIEASHMVPHSVPIMNKGPTYPPFKRHCVRETIIEE